MKNAWKIMITVSAFIFLIMEIVQPEATYAQPPKMKMTTKIPASITTPDRVNTRIGTLEFFDGFPTEDTAQKCFDNLDFLRGVEAFLNGCPGDLPPKVIPPFKLVFGHSACPCLFS